MTQEDLPDCVVTLTFKRIQQFLFAVPRLKAMTGANALLGETIRDDLVKIVEESSGVYLIEEDNAPESDNNDPLKNDDNPKELYKKGVISRDGGHFTAVFKSQEAADQFIQKAKKCIAEKLPTIQLDINCKVQGEKDDDSPNTPNSDYGESPMRLPQFMLCGDTGGIANIHRNNETPNYIADIVKHLEDAGDRFKNENTNDIIGLLNKANKLPGHNDKKGNSIIPQNLSDLAGSRGYIAVIHADGNNIGQRRKQAVGNFEQDIFDFDSYIKHEVKNETFFHSMRVAMRKSVVAALDCTFRKAISDLKDDEKLPYHLLMLGGDDLLLITRPEYAFPFVLSLSEKLKEHELSDNNAMSIGAGVVIAHHNVPFYHLHHLAENLASSAKKLFRQQEEEHSVVDWMVSTNSWIDNVEESRRLYDLSKDGKTCITGKPYFVLDDAAEKHNMVSLQTLWDAAHEAHKKIEDNKNKSDEEKLSRSKLKGLLQYISTFETGESSTYYQKISNLPDQISLLFGDKAEYLWESPDDAPDKKLTYYKDLLELIELHYLGRSDSGETNDHEENKQSTTGGGK